MKVNIEKQCSEILRELRRKKGLTLEEFEKFTGGAIKAVVLGSYERGTRAISLARLQQLANIYQVPVEHFFLTKQYQESADVERYTFDLRRIAIREDLDDTLQNVKRFLSTVVKKRRDWNGEVLTIRRSDTELLALLSELENVELKNQLVLNGFLFTKN